MLEENQVWIMFDGPEESLKKLDGFIKQQADAVPKGKTKEWEFLKSYRPKSYEIRGNIRIRDDYELVSVVTFCKDLVQQIPEIGFCGLVEWLYDSISGKASFFHLGGLHNLHWKKYSEDSYDPNWGDFGDSEGWIWDALTGKEDKRQPRYATSLFFESGVPSLDTGEFPVVAAVDPGKDLAQTKRIEQLQEGDPLLFEANWECKNDMPVNITILNEKKEPLGNLKADAVTLVLLAEYGDRFAVTADKIIPVAMKRKNAKYASLDVCINLALKKSKPRKKKPARWDPEYGITDETVMDADGRVAIYWIRFPNARKLYGYLAEDATIKVGDRVDAYSLVVADEVVAEVESIQYLFPNELSWPIEKTHRIHRKSKSK